MSKSNLDFKVLLLGIAVPDGGHMIREEGVALSRKPDVDGNLLAVGQLEDEAVDEVDLVGSEPQTLEFLSRVFRTNLGHSSLKQIFSATLYHTGACKGLMPHSFLNLPSVRAC